jgi:glycosyltransferase involved in cell wall biosynthesis
VKIGLNATCYNDRPSGAKQRFVGIYRELIKRLPEVEFVIYEPTDCRVGSWFGDAPNVSSRQTPIRSEGRTQKLIDGYRYWGAALRAERFDIFERFNLPIVRPVTGRVVQTIHDIRGLQSDHGKLKQLAYKAVVGRSLKAADHVITVSEAMKSEILSVYPDVPISVIYNGYAAECAGPADTELEVFREKFCLPTQFILAVGHFEKRKNYLRLIEAMALLRDRGRMCPLVIIGNDSGEKKAVEIRIESAKLGNSVKLLSGLSDSEVRCAYSLCNLFIFPSLYEGFGIPILEAMAARRPMVLSDIPVFREITQNQGVYFRPDDVEGMAFAIDHVLSTHGARARLVEHGNERVKAFSFHSLAIQVECLYTMLMRDKNR